MMDEMTKVIIFFLLGLDVWLLLIMVAIWTGLADWLLDLLEK